MKESKSDLLLIFSGLILHTILLSLSLYNNIEVEFFMKSSFLIPIVVITFAAIRPYLLAKIEDRLWNLFVIISFSVFSLFSLALIINNSVIHIEKFQTIAWIVGVTFILVFSCFVILHLLLTIGKVARPVRNLIILKIEAKAKSIEKEINPIKETSEEIEENKEKIYYTEERKDPVGVYYNKDFGEEDREKRFDNIEKSNSIKRYPDPDWKEHYEKIENYIRKQVLMNKIKPPFRYNLVLDDPFIIKTSQACSMKKEFVISILKRSIFEKENAGSEIGDLENVY